MANKLSNDTDSILYFSCDRDPVFNKQFRPYSEEYLARFKYEDERGRYRWQYMATYSESRLEELRAQGAIRWPEGSANPEYEQYLDSLAGIPMNNLWDDIFHVNPMANEGLGYPTQKPEALLERIVLTQHSNRRSCGRLLRRLAGRPPPSPRSSAAMDRHRPR